MCCVARAGGLYGEAVRVEGAWLVSNSTDGRQGSSEGQTLATLA